MRKLFFLLFFISISQAQIISPPKYEYEKVNWGDSFIKINNIFHFSRFELPEKSKNPFFKESDDVFQYISYDSVNSEKISIVFQFNSEDSTLKSIYVFNMDVHAVSHDEKANEAKRIEILNSLTSHYPFKYQERTVPFAGLIRVWSHTNSSVQAIILPSMVSLILSKP